jgi:rhodanese-related sulfurtransferase
MAANGDALERHRVFDEGRDAGVRYHFTFARAQQPRLFTATDMQFILSNYNWALVLAMIVSGAMLLWPMIGRRWSSMRDIGTAQATQLINRQNAVMLDLREPKEYEGGRVPAAIQIPLSQLATRGSELKKYIGRPLIALCERGNRSPSAASALGELGFTEIYSLHGGLRAWADAGMPVEKGA